MQNSPQLEEIDRLLRRLTATVEKQEVPDVFSLQAKVLKDAQANRSLMQKIISIQDSSEMALRQVHQHLACRHGHSLTLSARAAINSKLSSRSLSRRR